MAQASAPGDLERTRPAGLERTESVRHIDGAAVQEHVFCDVGTMLGAVRASI